jgi:hypothetical protein
MDTSLRNPKKLDFIQVMCVREANVLKKEKRKKVR